MKLQTKRTVGILLAATILAGSLFFATPAAVNAQTGNPWVDLLFSGGKAAAESVVTNVGGVVIVNLFKVIAYTLNFLGGAVFAFGNMLTETMLTLNYQVLSSSNTIVTVGWSITRDVANLGFVLLIILVALATIVRYPSEYQAQKLLPRLIAAALLVNFSLAIVTPLIDFSDTLTQSFQSRISGTSVSVLLPGSGFTKRITNAFGPQRLLIPQQGNTNSELDSGIGQFGGKLLSSLAGLFFSFIFTWLAALVMLAIAFMLFLRYVYLTFLLAIAPIVWLFWVFPGLESHWGTWWSNFIKWVFFAPATMFFIYLTMMAADAMAQLPLVGIGGSNFFEGLGLTVISQGVQMAVLGAFLVASLIVGQKLGIGGAGAALNIAKAAKTQGLKLAGQRVRAGGRAAAGLVKPLAEKAGVKRAAEKAKLLGKGFEVKPTDKFGTKLWKRTANLMTGVTGARAIATGVGKAPSGISTAAGRDIKKDNIAGSMFKSVKGEFLKSMGVVEEKLEPTTDDHQKGLIETLKQYAEFREKGVDTKGIDKTISSVESKFRGSFEWPRTEEGLTEIIKNLQDREDKIMEEVLKNIDPANTILITAVRERATKATRDLKQRAESDRDELQRREARKSEPFRVLEGKLSDLQTDRDQFVIERGRQTTDTAKAPFTTNITNIDLTINNTQKLMNDVRTVEARKPEGKAGWQARRLELDRILADIRTLDPALATLQVEADIRRKQDEADKEIRKFP